MLKEISAGIIIYKKTEEGLKFLILYHRRDYWNFPKGKIESEEKSFQAAIREVREETGLNRHDLKFHDYFKAYEKYAFWKRVEAENPQKVFKTVIFYLAETKKSQIILSSKHEEGYGWFTYKEGVKILSKHKESQRILTQANEFLKIKNSPVA
ncbi:MAG: NUDIX domain-containing protein [Patescibacteria group bacterium]